MKILIARLRAAALAFRYYAKPEPPKLSLQINPAWIEFFHVIDTNAPIACRDAQWIQRYDTHEN